MIFDPTFKRLEPYISSISSNIKPNGLYTLIVYDNDTNNNIDTKRVIWLMINIHGSDFLEENITNARTIIEYKPYIPYSEIDITTLKHDINEYTTIIKEYNVNIFIQTQNISNDIDIPIRNDFNLY